jgi:hypothetical protein
MRRSKYRRANSPAWFSGRRRIIALAAASLAAFGGVVAVTQISSASTENTARKDALAACDRLQAPANSRLSTQTRKGTYTTNNGRVTQHADDGAGDTATTAQVRTRCRDWVMKNVADTKAGSTNAGTKAGNANTGTNAGNANTGNTNAGNGAVATVNCPEVPIGVAVPASAKAEVDQNLAQLQKQIQEANARIASSQGQGGANFIQNAILNPLKDKRFATINRMETAIGRTLAKPNLNAEGLAPCSLNTNGGGNASPEPAQVPAKSVQAGAAAVANVGSISCPDVRINVAVPAQAQAEIDRNLALLQTQINEANARLKSSVGQGGANFVQNAILGPLKDKRFATINRMETAIGRNAAKPNLNADGLST